MRPRKTVTNLAWAAGGSWKCNPRNVPARFEKLNYLDEAACDAQVVQSLLVKDLAEPTAVIDMLVGSDDPRQIS